MVWLLALSW